MVRELLYCEQGGRELAPCVIAKERPANQARMTTWTRQLRKVARRTHIADRTMNTHCFLFGHLSTHDQVSVPNARRTIFPRSGSELWDWFAKSGIGCPKGRRPRCPVAALNPTKGFRVNA